MCHAGSALGEEELLRHADEQHDPGEEICPVKGAADDAAQAHQEREGQDQECGDGDVVRVEAGDLEGGDHDPRGVTVGGPVKRGQKLHAHQAYRRKAADQELHAEGEVPEAVGKEPEEHQHKDRGIENLDKAGLGQVGQDQQDCEGKSLPDPESLSLLEAAALDAQALSHHQDEDQQGDGPHHDRRRIVPGVGGSLPQVGLGIEPGDKDGARDAQQEGEDRGAGHGQAAEVARSGRAGRGGSRSPRPC